MRQKITQEERQHILRAYKEAGSFTKAAAALGMGRSRVVQQVRIARGLCPQCPNPIDDPAHTLCSKCRDELNKRTQKRWWSRISHGICGYCGNNPISERSESRCDVCLDMGAVGRKERSTKRIENGLCATCGKPICSESRYYCQKCLDRCRTSVQAHNSKTNFGGSRDDVISRDGGVCALCGKTPKRIEVHHIDGNRANNDISNLITICRYCHGALTHLEYSPNPVAVIDFFLSHYS